MLYRTLLCGLTGLQLLAQSVPTNQRVQHVVREFVAQTGQQVIGLGSWISNVNYKDVLQGGASDHDLRLVIQDARVTPAAAQREWQQARRALGQLVEKEFGKDAPKVLASINLYPPNQLMKGVEDTSDALGRFQKLGQVPNLAHQGPVTAATPKHLAEGLYGDGAKVWTQMYEQKSGRLFYRTGNNVHMGMVDLTHLAEGRGTHTLRGMANTSTQWIEHAMEEAAAGRGDRVAKYLERLERDLVKARDLARLGTQPAWRSEMREVIALLKQQPGAFAQVEAQVSSLLHRTHLESALMLRMERSGASTQFLLKTALKGLEAKDGLGRLLREAMKHLSPDQIARGVMAIPVAISLGQTAGRDGIERALVEAAPFLVSLPTSVLMGMTQSLLDAAREGGFNLAASTQDPWELLAGNFSALGRAEAASVEPITLDQLVQRIQTEERLSALVLARAHQAARRDIVGARVEADDARVAQSIYARCYPTILRAWQMKRDILQAEYLDLADRLRETAFLLKLDPPKLTLDKAGTGSVRCELQAPSSTTFNQHLERMKQILGWLRGGRPYALVTPRWKGGTEGGRETQRTYTVQHPGLTPIVCSVEITVNEPALSANDPMVQRFTLFTAVDLEVQGIASTGAPKPAPGANSGRLAALQRSKGFGLILNLPGGRKGVPAQKYAEEGYLFQFSNGYGPTLRLPLVWEDTTFSISGTYQNSGSQPDTFTMDLTGSVNAEGTEILELKLQYEWVPPGTSGSNEPYYRRQRVELKNIPILQPGLENVPLKDHIVSLSDTWHLVTTGLNHWSYLGTDWSKIQGSYLRVNFY